MMAAFEVLFESLSIRHLVAHTARRNFYQPVLVRIFHNCPSWRRGFLSWHVENVSMTYRIFILRTLLSRLKFSVHDICKLWSHCSHYKHDLHDYCGALWWVLRPLFPWGDKVIDHDTNIYIEWHNIIHGNRKERQSLLLRVLVKVHHHHHLASFLAMVIKTKYLYPRVNYGLPLLDRFMTISMHIDHNFCAAVFLWKLGATQ